MSKGDFPAFVNGHYTSIVLYHPILGPINLIPGAQVYEYSDAVKKIKADAVGEAKLRGCPTVTGMHLLAALLRTPSAWATTVLLPRMGVDVESLKREVLNHAEFCRYGDVVNQVEWSLAKDARDIFDCAQATVKRVGGAHACSDGKMLCSEHLLLGILATEPWAKSVLGAQRPLWKKGVTYDKAETFIRNPEMSRDTGEMGDRKPHPMVNAPIAQCWTETIDPGACIGFNECHNQILKIVNSTNKALTYNVLSDGNLVTVNVCQIHEPTMAEVMPTVFIDSSPPPGTPEHREWTIDKFMKFQGLTREQAERQFEEQAKGWKPEKPEKPEKPVAEAEEKAQGERAKSPRELVYEALDGERAYQEKVWGKNGSRRTNPNSSQGPEHAVGNWIMFMDYYLTQAKAELSTKHGHEAALHMLRKVTALGVACFEQHGCPLREEGEKAKGEANGGLNFISGFRNNGVFLEPEYCQLTAECKDGKVIFKNVPHADVTPSRMPGLTPKPPEMVWHDASVEAAPNTKDVWWWRDSLEKGVPWIGVGRGEVLPKSWSCASHWALRTGSVPPKPPVGSAPVDPQHEPYLAYFHRQGIDAILSGKDRVELLFAGGNRITLPAGAESSGILEALDTGEFVKYRGLSKAAIRGCWGTPWAVPRDDSKESKAYWGGILEAKPIVEEVPHA